MVTDVSIFPLFEPITFFKNIYILYFSDLCAAVYTIRGIPLPFADFKRTTQKLERLKLYGFERNNIPSFGEEVLVNNLEDSIRSEPILTNEAISTKSKSKNVERFLDIGILSKDSMFLFSESFEHLLFSSCRFSSCNWPNPTRHSSF
jgi:hypothetical protein